MQSINSGHIKLYALFIIAIAYFLTGCAGKPHKPAPHELLQDKIEYLFSNQNLANAQVGVYIEALDNEEIIYRKNEHRLFMPASNMKIFTSAASLIKLGPDFRFKTEFYADGGIDNGTLSGNLIVRGKGDPAISGQFRDDDPFAYFKDWADSLRQKGVKIITGDLVGDESYFSGTKLRYGWEWDDETHYYAPQISALNYNENYVKVTAYQQQDGTDSVNIQLNPDNNYLQIINSARIVSRDSANTIKIRRDRAKNIVRITGDLPRGSGAEKEKIAVEDPAMYFLHVFAKILRENDITINSSIRVSRHKENQLKTLLFTHSSPALQRIIIALMKDSKNLHAEVLLSTLGAEKEKEGTANKGIKVVQSWLFSRGISPNEFVMADGSGLSRKNLVSPLTTATLLRYMYHHPQFKYFYDSLPVAAEDGTIAKQLRGTLAQGKVHAKTGTLTRARALSGYVTDRSGRTYLFVTMFNNYTVPTAHIKNIQDRLCVLLSSWPR